MHRGTVQVPLMSQKLQTRRIACGPTWTPRSALQLRRSQACVKCSVSAASAISGTLVARRCACKWFLGASQHRTDALEACATKCRESCKIVGLTLPIFLGPQIQLYGTSARKRRKRVSYVFERKTEAFGRVEGSACWARFLFNRGVTARPRPAGAPPTGGPLRASSADHHGPCARKTRRADYHRPCSKKARRADWQGPCPKKACRAD